MLLTIIASLIVFTFTWDSSAVGGSEISRSPALPLSRSLVRAVDAIGLTVSDVDQSIDFFERVLSFEKVSETEVTGEDYEQLQGVFGLRMRVVRMKLGNEQIELTEYIAPRGRPIPIDSRSNDRWFQHIAIWRSYETS
jgi:Glyoxalase/Bleomycin resistance protein/Dioxygenase superfamily